MGTLSPLLPASVARSHRRGFRGPGSHQEVGSWRQSLRPLGSPGWLASPIHGFQELSGDLCPEETRRRRSGSEQLGPGAPQAVGLWWRRCTFGGGASKCLDPETVQMEDQVVWCVLLALKGF